MTKLMNSVKCLCCGEILISKSRHDFQMCKCDNMVFCDGGQNYSRIGGVDFEKIAVYDNELGEYVPMLERDKNSI